MTHDGSRDFFSQRFHPRKSLPLCRIQSLRKIGVIVSMLFDPSSNLHKTVAERVRGNARMVELIQVMGDDAMFAFYSLMLEVKPKDIQAVLICSRRSSYDYWYALRLMFRNVPEFRFVVESKAEQELARLMAKQRASSMKEMFDSD